MSAIVDQESRGIAEASEAGPSQCYHCGEPCRDFAFARAGKNFCCTGCQVVHDLLAEHGLEHFYNLEVSPGVRIRTQAKGEHWAYLDEPAIQQRLLDFTDGKIARVTFHIPAIHCIACVWLLENLFRLHAGIGQSQVNFPRREIAISFSPQEIRLSELVTLLVSIGYGPALTLERLEDRKPRSKYQKHWLQIGVAGFAFGNIMLFSLPGYLGLDSFHGPTFKLTFAWVSLLLAVPVLIYSASDYWRSALVSMKQRILTLDVPIALGLAALYGQSAFEILSGRGNGYLDSLTGLVFFLLCGRAFQHKTHERLAFERDYKSFFPLSVTRRISAAESFEGQVQEERVSLSQLSVGDQLIVRNQELIPADAKLTSESALIDYSFVTGEAEPVQKQRGDYLYAGGKQIGSAIHIEMVKPVSQSYLASLWSHEIFSKNSDRNINSLTNRYSRRFTALVVGIAIAAAIFWFASGNGVRAIKAFTSVLIVACPCALALAAPFTSGTAQRVLGRIGVFLKNPLVLERMADVDAIVFDKTGTLTSSAKFDTEFDGEPLDAAETDWICSLTQHSTHPYSRRINRFLPQHAMLTATAFKETPGCGIEGVVDGRELWIGSRAWLQARGVCINSAREGVDTNISTVCLAIDGRFRGSFVFANAIRPEIERLVHELETKCELALLSGDNENDWARFAALFRNPAQLQFNRTPLDKLAFIHSLQRSGKTVMMVGDGLNDAGALKQSDVGIAVVEDAGAFSPASDVIMETQKICQLDGILALARRANRIVRVCFGISALYNIVGVSIAAAGILSPLICAVLMPLSSVSVVLFACGATTLAARSALGLRRGSFRSALHEDARLSTISNPEFVG